MPGENDNDSGSRGHDVNEVSEAICRRALAFASTFKFVNPRIVSTKICDRECVAQVRNPWKHDLR